MSLYSLYGQKLSTTRTTSDNLVATVPRIINEQEAQLSLGWADHMPMSEGQKM